MYPMISLCGLFGLLFIAWCCSEHRKTFPWRIAGFGFLLQAVFAVFIFKISLGKTVFLFINDIVLKLFDCARSGAVFVFGPLALPPGMAGEQGEVSPGFILAFQALPTIIFFAGIMSMLYYLGILQRVIRAFAYIFTRLMRISGAESFCASNSIFVGIEASLTVRPYLAKMTRSELCTILTAGMATIASSMLAVYVSFLSNVFPSIAGHLISASILSAPAALIFSKIIVPERDTPETLGAHVAPDIARESSIFEAIINGAQSGVKLVAGIVAVLIAMLGLVALADMLCSSAGEYVNRLFAMSADWSLSGLLGYVFYPFSILIGIPLEDAEVAARIIGQRLVATELRSYSELARALTAGQIVHPRSAVIIAYALCGFAHVASLAIFTGGISALVPSRSADIASVGIKALFAATLACLATAAFAGIFCSDASILLGR